MDEKTEDLREIFMEVSDTATVTETQAETRGTLAGADSGAGEVDADVGEVVGKMRERYDFRTDLSREDYVAIVRAVHDGDGDATIAERLGLDPGTVFHARLDLHLLRDSDTDAPFDLSRLRASGDTAPDGIDIDEGELERYRRVVAARDEARAANRRYREIFEEILTDATLEGGYTDAVQEDGLRDAAEDIETDVSF